jgi:bifunctional non-homologous end joining protein LigD
MAALQRIVPRDSPFVTVPRPDAKDAKRAELVCEVKFTQWTQDGQVRQPEFKGMRENRPANEARREQA